MTFEVRQSRIRTLRPGDPGFAVTDGLVVSARAGFEISKSCPREYSSILQQAVAAGWIKPVAVLYDHELTWVLLNNDSL